MQSGSGSCPQGVPKGFVCFIIGTKFPYSFHLYDKEHKGLKAFGNSFGQALKVLYTPLCGSIGKADDSIFFQGYALYLHEGRF